VRCCLNPSEILQTFCLRRTRDSRRLCTTAELPALEHGNHRGHFGPVITC
jgi:hypothetical protein